MLYSILFILVGLISTGDQQVGKISGKVIDQDTKEPLIGVNIFIPETKQGAVTDIDGNYSIEKVVSGVYTLKASYVGYQEKLLSDVVVKSNRITTLPIQLKSIAIEGEGVVVTAGFFSSTERQPVSSVSFNNEEIRRSPGAGGEIGRVLQALPGVASTGETSQDLFVRGGSPNEINFYIDNIAIPSIKHFQEQNGTSNGPIGLVNTELVQNIEFSTGGFGAQYGYVTSGVGEITYRNANRERFLGNIDMTMAGFGGTFEIPDFDKNGSLLISGRRSYLDLIADAINAGGAPRYSDIQGKYHRTLTKYDEITVLGIIGASSFGNNEEQAEEIGILQLQDVNRTQATVGMNWQHLWSGKGYTNTSISYTRSDDNTEVFDMVNSVKDVDFNILQDELTLRSVSFFRLNPKLSLTTGLDIKYQNGDFNYSFAAQQNVLGQFEPALSINQSVNGIQSGVFVSFDYALTKKWSTQLGGRLNHSTFNDQITVDPRWSTKYVLNERVSLHAAAGLYHQRLPLYYLSQNESIQGLDEMQARHLIIGTDIMLTASTKMTIELFDKQYSSVPVLPTDSVNASSVYIPDAFDFYDRLESRGTSYARGIDLMIQKRLAENFYGGINISYLRSKYEDHLGREFNRDFDVQTLFSVIGGYRPSRSWEISARWSYVGARPFTPANETASIQNNTLILDQAQFNSDRLPAFHSLYLRFDKRFFYQKATFVTFVEIWNAYNRENEIGLFYNKVDQQVDRAIGFTFLPVGGFKFEF